MAYLKFVSTLIVALVLVSMLTVVATAVPVSAEEPSNIRVRVAKMILNGVSRRIDAVLNLAERYGISISENMTERVDSAKSILQNATEVVEEEPCKAIRMAVKACWVFKPVAIYILKNIPEEEKATLRENILLKAIEARENALSRLKNVISWLEDRGVKIPEEISNNIALAEDLLNQARELIESGSYNASDVRTLIGDASKALAKATLALHRVTGNIWKATTLVNFSLLRLRGAIILIGKAINATIEAIEANKTEEAIGIIDKTVNGMEQVITFLDKALETLERKNVNENVTEAVTALKNAMAEAKTHVEKARTSLEQGDTLSAISELETALDTIVTVVETYKHIFVGFHRHIEVLLTVSGKIHITIGERLKIMALRKAAWLVFHLERMDMRLHMLYHLYEEGKVSEEEFHKALDNAKTLLENLKTRLEKLPRPPKPIIEKINRMLEWITSVYSK